MKKILDLIPFFAGICVVIFTLIYENTLAVDYNESNRLLVEDTVRLIENQNINEDVLALVTSSLNNVVSNGESTLESAVDFVLALGFLLIIVTFPVRLFSKNE